MEIGLVIFMSVEVEMDEKGILAFKTAISLCNRIYDRSRCKDYEERFIAILGAAIRVG